MYFTSDNRVSPERWQYLQGLNSEDLSRFYRNVEYLALVRYKSREKAVRCLWDLTGFRTSTRSLRGFKSGRFTDSRFTVLRAWALLFGVSVADLLSRDYRAEDEAGNVK